MSHIVSYTSQESIRKERQVKIAKRQFMRYKGLTPDTDFDEFGGYREIGEFILYFLTESVLGYPMLISKMKFTKGGNVDVAVHGSDGIHIGIDEYGELKIYLGESKICNNLASAKDKAKSSFQTSLDPEGLLEKDLNLIGTHKDAWNIGGGEELRTKLESMINPYFEDDEPLAGFDFNIVCLLGYECDIYKKNIEDTDSPEYRAYAESQVKYMFRFFKEIEKIGDRKIELFMLPLFNHKELIRSFLNELNRE